MEIHTYQNMAAIWTDRPAKEGVGQEAGGRLMLPL